ncbi:MAG: hypothetical protein OXC44_03740 [Proteobacteria bacterium]|nr:hypothetical protein [Pseudomonadota bacterium]
MRFRTEDILWMSSLGLLRWFCVRSTVFCLVVMAVSSCRLLKNNQNEESSLSALSDKSLVLSLASHDVVSDDSVGDLERAYYFRVCTLKGGRSTVQCVNAFEGVRGQLNFSLVPVARGTMTDHEKEVFDQYRNTISDVHNQVKDLHDRLFVMEVMGAGFGGFAAIVGATRMLDFSTAGKISSSSILGVIIITLAGAYLGSWAGRYVALDSRFQTVMMRIKRLSAIEPPVSSPENTDSDKTLAEDDIFVRKLNYALRDNQLGSVPLLSDMDFDHILSKEQHPVEDLKQYLPLLAIHLISTGSFDQRDITKWCVPHVSRAASMAKKPQCFKLN